MDINGIQGLPWFFSVLLLSYNMHIVAVVILLLCTPALYLLQPSG